VTWIATTPTSLRYSVAMRAKDRTRFPGIKKGGCNERSQFGQIIYGWLKSGGVPYSQKEC